MARIGRHVRELRTRRNLSVRELASRSGLSHATVSLIERDRTSPTIDTLAAIADALGTTLIGFLRGVEPGLSCSPFYSPQELMEIGERKSISYLVVGGNHPDRQILMMYETYQIGADTGKVGLSHKAQEAGFVLSGKIEITVGTQSRVLEKGDAYYFDSVLPHRFRNVGNTKAEIISAVTPPTY